MLTCGVLVTIIQSQGMESWKPIQAWHVAEERRDLDPRIPVLIL
jgi:hypothetical protein